MSQDTRYWPQASQIRQQPSSLSVFSRYGPSVKHEQFYYEDGSVVLLLPGTPHNILYRLHISLLKERSLFFRGLFSLQDAQKSSSQHPHTPSLSSMEGTTDDNPIILSLPNGATAEDFESLLNYLFCGHDEKNLSNRTYLVSILMLSTFLEIEDVRSCAINHFENLLSFHPALRLQLARLYRVDTWIEPAFRELLCYSPERFTLEDVDRIGLISYHLLDKTKARIRQHRLYIAYTPPEPQNSLDCEHPLRCITGWKREWCRGLAPHVLHSNNYTPQHLLDLLETTKIPDMCDNCQILSIEDVKRRGVFQREEELVQSGIKEMMEWQTDKAIRAGLQENIVPRDSD